MTREEALNSLLQPIAWDWRTSIEYRQNLVTRRHKEVDLVLPFLTPDEVKLVKKWKRENKHDDLWD